MRIISLWIYASAMMISVASSMSCEAFMWSISGFRSCHGNWQGGITNVSDSSTGDTVSGQLLEVQCRHIKEYRLTPCCVLLCTNAYLFIYQGTVRCFFRAQIYRVHGFGISFPDWVVILVVVHKHLEYILTMVCIYWIYLYIQYMHT